MTSAVDDPTPGTQPAETARPQRRSIRDITTRLAERAPPWLGPVLTAWIATRILVVVAAWAAANLVASGSLDHIMPLTHPGRITTWDVLGGWDGAWYQRIAVYGYPAHVSASTQSAVAFFPLVPAAIAALHAIGLPVSIAAFCAAQLAGLLALCALAALTHELLGADTACRTAVYVAISPAAYVLSMPYGESFAMASGFAAAVFALRRRHGAAAVCGVLAGLTRITGVFFVIPLAAIALRGRSRRLAAVAASPLLGLGVYSLFLWRRTGDAFAYSTVQAAWHRQPLSGSGLLHSLRNIASQIVPHGSLANVRDVSAALVAIALLAYAARLRLPAAWVVFGLLMVLVPLATRSVQSVERFTLLAAPVFWALAELGKRQWFDRTYRIVAPGLMAITVLVLPVHWP